MVKQFIKLPTLTNKLILGEVTTVSEKLNMLESFYNKRLTIIKTLQQLLKNTELALDMYYINNTFYLMTDDKLLSQWCCSNPVIRGELVDACDIQLVTHSEDKLTEEDDDYVEEEEDEEDEEDAEDDDYVEEEEDAEDADYVEEEEDAEDAEDEEDEEDAEDAEDDKMINTQQVIESKVNNNK